MGLLRLLTNQAVMGPDACTTKRAWEVNDALLADPRFQFQQEPAGLEASLRAFTKGFGYSSKLWQDAYLAAFAVSSALRLVSFDRGFRKFAGLECEVLEAG